MTSQQQFKAWDEYVEEAAHAPFQLPVSKDETLIIKAPTAATLIVWARAYRSGDVEAMLSALAGEHWGRLEQLLANAGHTALEHLVTDMMLFFDLAEDVELIGPGGGKVKEKDPRKIRALMNTGYRPAGEAASRT